MEVLPRAADNPGEDECRAYAWARRLTRKQRWPEAQTAWDEAARRAKAHSRPSFLARVFQEQGVFLANRNDFPAAERSLRESLRLLRQSTPGTLAEAATWHALGRLARLRGDVPLSVTNLSQALDLRSRLAPGSLEHAATLNNLGIDAWYQGDTARAKSLYLQALGLIHQRAPDSLDEASLRNNLGLLSRSLGDTEAAAAYLSQAASLWQKLDPESPDLARCYDNLGSLASDRGDLALSESYHQEALRRFEALAPESAEVAEVLTNLGMVARDRYELTEADVLFRRALAIQQRLVPGSRDEARTLSNLAWILQETDRLDEAETFARQALAIRSRIAPGSQEVALSLAMLGVIALKHGSYRTASSLGEQALALQHLAAPGTLLEAEILNLLGRVELDRGRPRNAETRARQSLAIFRRLAPRSSLEAESLNLLGLALWKSKRPAEALPVLTAAIDTLEAQIGRLGGTDEARSGFQARFWDFYSDLIALQVELGEEPAAFQTLERWRGRMLLTQIAERDLVFSSDVPVSLLRQQRELDRQYEKTQREIARLDAAGDPELPALLIRLSRLRNQRSALVARIVRASPHYASLRYPQPLDLPAARHALDPGTVWLSYSVGEKATFLFVVTPEAEAGTADSEAATAAGLQVLRLPIGRQELATETAVFRGLILRGKGHTTVEEALFVQGQKLYDLLIAPAAPWIEGADRILISPDGPLQTLPFAALVRPGEERQFLVDWKPLHTVLSATLYAELRRSRPEAPPGSGTLVAFADPLVRPAPGATATPDDSPLRRYRAGLPPLPGAREEVRALADLYGQDALIYTGAAATEKRLEHLPVRPRYLHLACHALLDRRSPLDSALALATPARDDPGDNGMLQAWEIIEHLRLDADLGLRHGPGPRGRGRGADRLDPRLPVRRSPLRPRLALGRLRPLDRGADAPLLRPPASRSPERRGPRRSAAGAAAQPRVLPPLLLGGVRAERGLAVKGR
jgi:tetratricopeptide (TPR) repeat protein